MTQHKMTMHEIGAKTAQKAALLTSHMAKLRKRSETVPKIGSIHSLDHDGILRHDRDGNERTPTIKMRFNDKQSRWEQIRPLLAGLMVFFKTDPEAHHTKFRIVSVVPNGRACYAEPE